MLHALIFWNIKVQASYLGNAQALGHIDESCTVFKLWVCVVNNHRLALLQQFKAHFLGLFWGTTFVVIYSGVWIFEILAPESRFAAAWRSNRDYKLLYFVLANLLIRFLQLLVLLLFCLILCFLNFKFWRNNNSWSIFEVLHLLFKQHLWCIKSHFQGDTKQQVIIGEVIEGSLLPTSSISAVEAVFSIHFHHLLDHFEHAVVGLSVIWFHVGGGKEDHRNPYFTLDCLELVVQVGDSCFACFDTSLVGENYDGEALFVKFRKPRLCAIV